MLQHKGGGKYRGNGAGNALLDRREKGKSAESAAARSAARSAGSLQVADQSEVPLAMK